MSQFIGTIDVSAERRAQFAQRAERQLAAAYASPPRIFEYGDLVLVCAGESWEPFRHTESTHGVSFVWGHAMERGENIANAADPADLWSSLPQRMPPPLEGMHSALLYRADGSWFAGADFSGMVPLYHYSGKDYAIVGSSPEVFHAHPDFDAKLDPAGLAGILLTNGLIGGRSLLRGVRRLGSGNLLHGSRGRATRELAQYRPEVSDRYFGSSFEDNYRRVREALHDCFNRHLQTGGEYGLLLSGGLDSRLMAGLMQRHGAKFTAFSFGSPSDIEMQCAVAVAGTLGLEQRTLPIRMENYVEYAENECRWKHLANGFNSLLFHEPIPEAARLHGMLSGFTMEGVIGASHVSWAGNVPSEMSFGKFFKKVNRWGMLAPTVKQLLAKSFDATIVDEVLQETEQIYNGYSEHEFQRAWLFDHYHRSRYHTSSVLGLHSRWPWPVVPYIDTAMMSLTGGMPYAHLEGRRMQYHMLKQEFAPLARIPLDRNSFYTKPLLPRFGRQTDRVLFKLRELFFRCTGGLRERRFYYRTFDFDSPGWHAVRAAAEPHRHRVLRVLDEATVAEVLPQPTERRSVPDKIIDASKMKCMVGLLLWSSRYL